MDKLPLVSIIVLEEDPPVKAILNNLLWMAGVKCVLVKLQQVQQKHCQQLFSFSV
jgi:hypothetical protein